MHCNYYWVAVYEDGTTRLECPKCFKFTPIVWNAFQPPLRKPIHSSHLALRFYARDGWTLDELNSCISRGEVYCAHPDVKIEDRYYVLNHHKQSAFDVEKLMLRMSELFRYAPSAYDGTSDFDYISSMNW